MTGETSPRLSKRQRNLVLHPKKTIILLFLLSWLKFLLHDVDSIPWTTILFQYFLKNFSYFLYLSPLYLLFPLYIFRPFDVEVTFALHVFSLYSLVGSWTEATVSAIRISITYLSHVMQIRHTWRKGWQPWWLKPLMEAYMWIFWIIFLPWRKSPSWS